MNIVKLFSVSFFLVIYITGPIFISNIVWAGENKPQLVNDSATAETKVLFDKILSLSSNTENRVLSGIFGGYSTSQNGNWNGNFSPFQYQEVYKLADVYPAIHGCDYAQGWKSYSGHPKEAAAIIDYSCNAILKENAKNGSIAHISVHLPSPVYFGPNKQGFKKLLSNTEYLKVLVQGTVQRERWLAMLDAVAVGLLDLQESGVPVIFRPLHEMNGDWFWWGASSRKENDPMRNKLYIALYKDIFHYFSDVKGLNNLIWLWSPDAGIEHLMGYYPGNEFVDLVGVDIYFDVTENRVNLAKLRNIYNQILSIGKPFGLSEIGPTNTNGTLDYYDFIVQIEHEFPDVKFFMSWNDGWSPIKNKNAGALFRHPWVANANEY